MRSAWWLIATGMLSGAVLGLWSFGGPVPAPPGFEGYSDVPRRLLRLSHIALVALPVIGLEYARHVVALSARTRTIGCRLWLFGMVCLPALLALTAFVPPVLYLLSAPVLSLSTAVVLLAHGLRSTESASATDACFAASSRASERPLSAMGTHVSPVETRSAPQKKSPSAGGGPANSVSSASIERASPVMRPARARSDARK